MTTSSVRGTQSMSRAVRLIKAVSSRSLQGWRLTDLAAFCGFDTGSAHRMLAGLVRERLIEQRRSDRHYLPGPLLFELGLGVPRPAWLVARCAPALADLARASQGVAFLYLPSGEEFVCALRVGDTALKGMSIEVGTRRPLVVSAGGAAILLALPETEQQAVIHANLQQIEGFGSARVAAVNKMLRRSRRHGFGVNLADVVPGINAFSVALLDEDSRPFASISVVGHVDAMPRSRMREFQALLAQAAAPIEADYRARP